MLSLSLACVLLVSEQSRVEQTWTLLCDLVRGSSVSTGTRTRFGTPKKSGLYSTQRGGTFPLYYRPSIGSPSFVLTESWGMGEGRSWGNSGLDERGKVVRPPTENQLFHLHIFQTVSGIYTASCPLDTGESFLENKRSGREANFNSIWSRGLECVELHLHSNTRLCFFLSVFKFMLSRIKRPKREAKTVFYCVGPYPYTLVNLHGVLLNSAQHQITNNIQQNASQYSRTFAKKQWPDIAVQQPCSGY